jgi:molybdopterin synthase catalytic subunit
MPADEPVIDVQLFSAPVRYVPMTPVPSETGGECVFLGRTRAETHPTHGALSRLRYDAYPQMAERVLVDLADEAVRRFDARAVRVHHAMGPVPIGDASVLVQVMCPHRAAAFDACRFLIDALKERAPIWKREDWADGTTWSEGSPVPIPETTG